MARGVNVVHLIGNITRDVEVRRTGEGVSMATFTVACTEEWTDKQTGNKQTRTEFANVVAWRKLADICHDYLKKGDKVYIQGKMQTDQYEKDGVRHYYTKVIANQMQMLGGKPQGVDTSKVEEEDIPF